MNNEFDFNNANMMSMNNNADDDEEEDEEEDEDIKKANEAKLNQERKYDEFIKRKEASEIKKKQERAELAEKWIAEYKASRAEKIYKNKSDNRTIEGKNNKAGFELVAEIIDKLGMQVGAKSDLSRFKELINKKADQEKKSAEKNLL
eukprot:Mrub_12329.p1 GENE.Mrub_12329~~Mrub_12329.p1  ORF type:complete len:170 (+),score=61.00 Mrub_12329:70-510(+)